MQSILIKTNRNPHSKRKAQNLRYKHSFEDLKKHAVYSYVSSRIKIHIFFLFYADIISVRLHIGSIYVLFITVKYSLHKTSTYI